MVEWWKKKKKLNKLIKNTTAPLFFLPFPYLIVLLHLTASSDGGVDSKHHRSITRRSVDHLLLPKTTPEKNSTQHSYPTLPSATHPQNKFRPPKKSPKKAFVRYRARIPKEQISGFRPKELGGGSVTACSPTSSTSRETFALSGNTCPSKAAFELPPTPVKDRLINPRSRRSAEPRCRRQHLKCASHSTEHCCDELPEAGAENRRRCGRIGIGVARRAFGGGVTAAANGVTSAAGGDGGGAGPVAPSAAPSSPSGLGLSVPASSVGIPEAKGHQKDISGRGDDGSPSG